MSPKKKTKQARWQSQLTEQTLLIRRSQDWRNKAKLLQNELIPCSWLSMWAVWQTAMQLQRYFYSRHNQSTCAHERTLPGWLLQGDEVHFKISEVGRNILSKQDKSLPWKVKHLCSPMWDEKGSNIIVSLTCFQEADDLSWETDQAKSLVMAP